MIRSHLDFLIEDDAEKILRELLQTSSFSRHLSCLNPHSIYLSARDSEFKESLQNCDWIVPDGVGLILGSFILNFCGINRITGSDIFHLVSREINSRKDPGKVFFVGSTKENLEALVDKYRKDYPNVEVCGHMSPPFKDEFCEQDYQEVIRAILVAKPDFVWVGLGAPKQEKFCNNLMSRLSGHSCVFLSVGAVFDFYTGKVKRAHKIYRDFGLEWLSRLIQQPRRLWKRMFISAPYYIFLCIKTKFEQ